MENNSYLKLEKDYFKDTTKKNEGNSSKNMEDIKNLNRDDFYKVIRNKIYLNQLKGKVLDTFVCKEETTIEFSFVYFFKYLFYHVLYFFLIGPFSLIIVLPVEGYAMAYNMGFIGMTLNHIFGLIMYIFLVPNFLLIIYFSKVIKYELYVFTYIFMMIRLFIIAFRYGYSSQSSIEKRKMEPLNNLDSKKEYIIPGWKEIDPEICEIEVNDSMIREQIDSDLFTFSYNTFINDYWIERLCSNEFNEFIPQEEYNNICKFYEEQEIKYANLKDKIISKYNRLREPNLKNVIKIFQKELNIFSKKKSDFVQNSIELEKKFPFFLINPEKEFIQLKFAGKIMVKESILFSRCEISTKFEIFIYSLVVLQCFIPLIFFPFKDANFLDYYCIFVNIFSGCFNQVLNKTFLLVGGNDCSRRLFMMKQLETMLDLEKYNTNTSVYLKCIPLLNIFEEENYISWGYYRTLTLDIGRRYRHKIELYSSCFFILALGFLIIMVSGYFKIIKWLSFESIPIFSIMSVYQILIIGIVLFRMFFLAAQVNEYSEKHIMQLNKLRNQLNLIIENIDVIKKTEYFINPYLRWAKNFLIFDNDNKNLLGLNEEEFKVSIEKCITATEFAVEKIELESREKPLKLLFFKLDYKFIKQCYMAILTLAFSILQQYLPK